MAKIKTKKKKGKVYTKGEINRLVDTLVHPLYKKTDVFRVLDGLLHAIVEEDAPTSIRKFFQYNLPDLMKKTTEEHLQK